MKLRRIISLLLLTVYLLATGGTAIASLSCHCARMATVQTHTCCHHCEHTGDLLAAKADFSAPCCGNHHSTEIKLYTTSNESEKHIGSIVTDLPPSMAAECPCPAHIPLLREKVAQRRAPFVREVGIPAIGFRAPPVLA